MVCKWIEIIDKNGRKWHANGITDVVHAILWQKENALKNGIGSI